MGENVANSQGSLRAQVRLPFCPGNTEGDADCQCKLPGAEIWDLVEFKQDRLGGTATRG